jgi:sulfite exporter TauE/SafE
MCGPYVALCAARVSPPDLPAPRLLAFRLLFNAGRIATYVAIGTFAGAFGQIAIAAGVRSGLGGAVALIAGIAALLFGLALAGGIRDPSGWMRRSGLDVLIRGGMQRAFRAPPRLAALSLGALQGAFPCALVYGAASRAAASGTAPGGAATMLVFGLGTVPAIFALSAVPSGLIHRMRAWRWAGVFVSAVGILLILRGLAALGYVRHSMFW